MKAKIFVTTKLPEDVIEFLEPHCDLDIWEGVYPINKDEIADRLKDVDGILGTHLRVNQKLLDLAPKYRIHSNISVGYDNFDTDLMAKNNIIGTHTPSVLDDTVADLAVGMMLAAGRRIAYFDKYVKEGKWKATDNEELFGLDIYGKTLGILGLGRIGTKIAKRASLGFDMNVIYYSRTRKENLEEEFNLTYKELDDLLKESDYVVCILPLNKETEKFLGAREFELMKETAFFINIARGKIVDEAALIKALQEGKIAGAALDVYEKEPVDLDNPLLKMDNVVTLPHMGSSTRETRDAMAMMAAKDLLLGLQGKKPENIVPELR